MRPPPKYPTTELQPPHQGLVEGFDPFCPAFPPCYCLPYLRQVPISCHPASEAELQDQEGCNPPLWRSQGGG